MKNIIPNRVSYAFRCLIKGIPTSRKESADWYLGMTTKQEQMFYRTCSEQYKDIKGVIVDLGCWMGSTAFSLAEGLKASAKPTKIYAYDLFRWETWMDQFDGMTACDYLPGESFLPEARRRMQKHKDCVELIQADLVGYQYGRGPIKILLVDAMKTAALSESICIRFFTNLQPGGLLIHQDFKHYFTPWIHIIQFRLRKQFRFTHEVPESGTVAFELLERIEPSEAEQVANLEQVSDAEVEEAIQYSLGIVSNEERSPVAAAHVMHFVHAGRNADAHRLLESYRGKLLITNEDHEQILKHLR
jgi:hypothetical protein